MKHFPKFFSRETAVSCVNREIWDCRDENGSLTAKNGKFVDSLKDVIYDTNCFASVTDWETLFLGQQAKTRIAKLSFFLSDSSVLEGLFTG